MSQSCLKRRFGKVPNKTNNELLRTTTFYELWYLWNHCSIKICKKEQENWYWLVRKKIRELKQDPILVIDIKKSAMKKKKDNTEETNLKNIRRNLTQYTYIVVKTALSRDFICIQ